MKITRRFFARLFLTSSLLVLAFTTATPKPAAGPHYLAFVGTYTNKTASKGIYAFDFDSASGKLTAKGVAAETPDPSWAVIHPNGKFAYAANESGKQSTVSAFSIDAKSARLTLLNQLPALGEDPCYLSFDKTRKFLFVANYTSGNVVVFPILPDGKLGAATANVKDTGILGPNKERQEAPHAHWVDASRNQGFAGYVYVADLGLDRVLAYAFDPKSGTLSPVKVREGSVRSKVVITDFLPAKLPPGSGPRHVAFSPDGFLWMYVLNELKSTVTVLTPPGVDYDTSIHPIQTISTLPEGFAGRNDAAEIAIHPNGKWLFASNRGHDTIMVFSIDPRSRKLKATGDFPTGGKEPRHFALDPTGQFLLAENQNSNSIVVFRIDPATGALTQVSKTDDIPSPVCLVFLP
jgi:6-phosphogluconolactonase